MAQDSAQKQVLLQNIQTIARNLKKKSLFVDRSRQPSTSNPAVIDIPSLDLSYDIVMDDVLYALQDMDIPKPVVHRLLDRTGVLVSDLIKSYSEIFGQTCQNLISTPLVSHPLPLQIQELRRTYTNSFNHSLLSIKSTIVSAATNWQRKQIPISRKRTAFNNQFTPFLEKYFEYNAYPSACDRLRLARTSMMTSRQIEVWFQNHRRRWRKDGRPLRRLSSHPLPYKLDLESLERTMPHLVNKGEASPELSSHDEEITHLHQSVVPNIKIPDANPSMHIPVPTHAFPTPFDPYRADLPFSDPKPRRILPPPVWMRRPSTRPVASALIDIHELTAAFNLQLTIWGPASRTNNSMDLWFASKVTVPSLAPHPALVLPSFKLMGCPSSRRKAALYPYIRLPTNIVEGSTSSYLSPSCHSSSYSSDIPQTPDFVWTNSRSSTPSTLASSPRSTSPDPPLRANDSPCSQIIFKPTQLPATLVSSDHCSYIPSSTFGFSHFPPATLIGL